MLLQRILSAIVLLPLIVLVGYVGGIAWFLAISVAGTLAWREMAGLLQRDRFSADLILGLTIVLGLILEAYLHASGLVDADLLRPLLAGLLVASLIWALFRKDDHATADWGVTFAAALYLGLLLSHFVLLRERSDGFIWLMLAFSLTWIVDSMAYFVGSWFGKHKLWPRISPRKTWEGLFGGTAAVLIAAPLLGMWWLQLNPWLALLLGLIVAALDPFGDFTVSLFKRMARVKDSSGLIPGHGGMLDRLDSLLFVFPVMTYFALIIAGP